MMASPAQVCDDNNANGGQDETSVNLVAGKPIAHGRSFIKHEWKVKKMNLTKLNKSKRGVIAVHNDVLPGSQPKSFGPMITIIHDPTHDFPPFSHTNGYVPNYGLLTVKSMSPLKPHDSVCFNKSDGQLRLTSGHNSLCSPSYCVTKFGNGNGRYDTKTNGNGFSTIVHDPIIIDPAHQNMPDPIDPKLVDR